MKPLMGIGAALIILAALFSTLAEADTAQQDFAQGFDFIMAGKLKAATAKFEHGLKVEPDNAQAHFYLAEAYLGLKQNDKARAHYEKSLRLAPLSPVAHDAKNRLEMLSDVGNKVAVSSEFKDCKTCPAMVVVPPGQFIMGSPPSEIGRDSDEGPPHLVKIARPFAVGKFEVSLEEWDACVTEQACSFPKDGDSERTQRPVFDVSYKEVLGYLKWLAHKTGKNYRLLSEAEWEYAARSGSNETYYWGHDPYLACKFANVADKHAKTNALYGTVSCDDFHAETSPVGSYKPNAYGLYDMLGNVMEWVADCYNKTYDDAPTDGSAWTKGDCSLRVGRGGSWISDAASVRSAKREWNGIGFRSRNLGFRVARELP